MKTDDTLKLVICSFCGTKVKTYAIEGKDISCELCGSSLTVRNNSQNKAPMNQPTKVSTPKSNSFSRPKYSLEFAIFIANTLQAFGVLGIIGACAYTVEMYKGHFLVWLPILVGGIISGTIIIALGLVVRLQVEIASDLRKLER